jgi:2-polyprenyl-3-methyl-5-hydroxy-6-metoxy-1,4-benzoquinol methylase
MRFEITLEGPAGLLEAVSRELSLSGRPAQGSVIPDARGAGSEARLVLEETEETVNARLEQAGATVDRVETRFGMRDRIAFEVRNRAYAEPPAGGDRPRDPFRPVPSVVIQPWYPGVSIDGIPGAILLDPAHAFGTGGHPTTRMCLRCLEGIGLEGIRGKRVLDFGCGTAILSLAASGLGADGVLGVERDPDAAAAAVRNVDLNGWGDRISIQTGSWEQVTERFDLVLANLVPAALLLSESAVHDHLKDGAAAVISGFGRARMEEMAAFFEATGLRTTRRLHEEGWGALVMVRPGKGRC